MDSLDMLQLRNDVALLKELTGFPGWRVLVKYAERAMDGVLARGFRDPTAEFSEMQYLKGVWAGIHDTLQIPERLQHEVSARVDELKVG